MAEPAKNSKLELMSDAGSLEVVFGGLSDKWLSPSQKRQHLLEKQTKSYEKAQMGTQLPFSGSFSSEKPSSNHPKQGVPAAGTGDRFIPSHSWGIARQLFALPETAFLYEADVSCKSEKEQNNIIFEAFLERELLQLDAEHVLDVHDDNREQNPTSFSGSKQSYKPAKRGSFHLSDRKPASKSGYGPAEHEAVGKRPKILHFSDRKANRHSETVEDFDCPLSGSNKKEDNPVLKNIRHMRRIGKTPLKVLDAPGLLDDFYQVSVLTCPPTLVPRLL